jgi:hypothetical protein
MRRVCKRGGHAAGWARHAVASHPTTGGHAKHLVRSMTFRRRSQPGCHAEHAKGRHRECCADHPLTPGGCHRDGGGGSGRRYARTYSH